MLSYSETMPSKNTKKTKQDQLRGEFPGLPPGAAELAAASDAGSLDPFVHQLQNYTEYIVASRSRLI